MGEHFVVGTAGHVDHGKTALVKALTGVDTDRLPEEKQREMTIDLGFARWRLPSGRMAAIVDVPGHERFIANMLAGATGVDLVLFCVAADEGVMPQTVEHLDVLHLLGLGAGIVVLTKADLVDAEMLALAREEVGGCLAGTFLAGAPLVAASARDRGGLAELAELCDAALAALAGRPAAGPPRLPIDRVFVAPGFGTVVTGTLLAGTVFVDQRLVLLPAGAAARVRMIEVHGQRREQAEAGERVALNLAGVSRAGVGRGDVLAAPDVFAPTRQFDGELHYLNRNSRPLENRTRVHLHVGTSEVTGRVLLLDGAPRLEPGSSGLVQFQAETPLVVATQDRFIVRSYSPVRVIGGGVVLDPRPARRRRRPRGDAGERLVGELAAARTGDPAILAAQLVKAAGEPLDWPALERRLAAEARLGGPAAAELLRSMADGGELVAVADGAAVFTRRSWRAELTRLTDYLRSYHDRWPLRRGASREEVRAGVAPAMSPRLMAAVLARAAADGAVAVSGDRLCLPGFAPRLDGPAATVANRIIDRLRRGGLAPPDVGQLRPAGDAAGAVFDQVLEHLGEMGVAVRLTEAIWLHSETVAAARQALLGHLANKDEITVSDFRRLVGTTRKYALPLLEYFDGLRLTRRAGGARVRGASFAAAAAAAGPAARAPGDQGDQP